MKHTKGPWNIKDYKNFDTQIISDNKIICSVASNLNDAFLIAAAPELLRVCELIVKEWDQDHSTEQKGTLIARLSQYSDIAKSALKKARGE